MTEINMTDLKPVGEFGSKEWCEACARYGVQILEDADLPLGAFLGGSFFRCRGRFALNRFRARNR